jgi:zinc D-Ala-D-Ala carboxypeptidase
VRWPQEKKRSIDKKSLCARIMAMPRNLTPHFTVEEFERSTTARVMEIDNRLPEHLVPAVKALCENVLEPLRSLVGRPVSVTSGYRCEKLNTAIRGALRSQHTKGEAADIRVAGMSVEDLASHVLESANGYDQVILEPSWVHVSWKSPEKNRMQVLDMQGKWDKK